jgi:hypothetical protein
MAAVLNAKKISVFDRPVVKKTPDAKVLDANETLVLERLHTLTEYTDELEAAEAGLEAKIEELIPPKAREAIKAMREEFAPMLEGAEANIEELKATIKEIAVGIGHTVPNGRWQAVWAKPRQSWNNDKLEAYAAGGHPEVLDFREVGLPTVSIRPKSETVAKKKKR